MSQGSAENRYILVCPGFTILFPDHPPLIQFQTSPTFVADTKFFRQRFETRVGRPQLHPVYDRRSQQVNVDPADATAVKTAAVNKLDNFEMRNHRCFRQELICSQQLAAAATISDQKFPVDELMSHHIAGAQKPVQVSPIRLAVGETTNPNGCIDQNHQAALRLTEGFSRRLGTSLA